MKDAVLYVHDEMLDPGLPVYAAGAGLPRVFVFDEPRLAAEGWSLARLAFVADGLAALPGVEVWAGTPARVLDRLGVRRVLTQRTPQAWTAAAFAGREVAWVDEPAFAGLPPGVVPVRFMRYWKRVEPSFFPPEAAGRGPPGPAQ